MIESSSRYFHLLPHEGPQGDVVIEQIFPPLAEGKAKEIKGKPAEAILDRAVSKVITVRKLSDRPDTVSKLSIPQVHVIINPRLEVSSSFFGAGNTFELDGWELINNDKDGSELVSAIEAQLGVSGLTIVLERGITERRPNQTLTD